MVSLHEISHMTTEFSFELGDFLMILYVERGLLLLRSSDVPKKV